MSHVITVRRSFLLLISALILMPASRAAADDIVPPPWFGDDPPFATLQEWEFVTPAATPPDGEIPTMSPGVPFVTPSGDLIYIDEPSPPVGLNGWLGGPAGGTLTFDIPNIPDDRPVKHLRIQINGIWDMSPPPVVTGLLGIVLPGTPAPGVFVTSAEAPFPGFHRWEDWDIFPNPDFETLTLSVPPLTFVNQVVIHTISIPEPGTAMLLMAPAVLGLLKRRRSA